jgi:hypothetical protein
MLKFILIQNIKDKRKEREGAILLNVKCNKFPLYLSPPPRSTFFYVFLSLHYFIHILLFLIIPLCRHFFHYFSTSILCAREWSATNIKMTRFEQLIWMIVLSRKNPKKYIQIQMKEDEGIKQNWICPARFFVCFVLHFILLYFVLFCVLSLKFHVRLTIIVNENNKKSWQMFHFSLLGTDSR